VDDHELRADLAAILGGGASQKAAPNPRDAHSQTAQPTGPARAVSRAPRAQQRGGQQAAGSDEREKRTNDARAANADGTKQPTENRHAIFDKIAENMRFASAYDLGSVTLSNRFDRFDSMPRRSPPIRKDPVARRVDAGARVSNGPSRAASF